MRSIIQALDPAMVTLALEGSTSYRDRHELVYRHRAERPNAIWQADHTQLDILIQNPDGTATRPWITIIDDYSRAVCGYMVTITAPSAMNTDLALRQAIWRKTDPTWAMCGTPDVLYVDHGSGFTSGHIAYTTTALKIRIIHSTIARPQGRGKVERFFSTFNIELLTTLPGHLAPASETHTRSTPWVCCTYSRPMGWTGCGLRQCDGRKRVGHAEDRVLQPVDLAHPG